MAEDEDTKPQQDKPATYVLTPEEEKRRKERNIAVALAVAGFMLIVFLVTILRLGGNVAERTF